MPERPALSPAQVVNSGLCIGCGGCAAEPGRRMAWDRAGQRKPEGPDLDRPSESFARTCPFSPVAANEDRIAADLFGEAATADPWIGRHLGAFVGHAETDGLRTHGSSGGMVTWVAAELLRRGLVDGVLHVTPETEGDRLFRYRISRSEAEVRGGAKSRYYPIDLAEVIAEVRARPGRYAFVGVPCFVKAIQLLRREDPVLDQRIAFTLGLFCGHMKSAHFTASIARQLGAAPSDVAAIDFRKKDPSRPANWYRAQLTLRDGSIREQDWWHLADGDWGAGFFQNSACNFCDDVSAETADIAFGDAWVEPYSSDGRGTNVVVVRSRAMRDLVGEGIAAGVLSLEAVDAEFVRETQAAGFRQRREGLAYRLTWARRGLRPRKRVVASAQLPADRKLIYRARAAITVWSDRMFRLSERLGRADVYRKWAWTALTTYQALAYRKLFLKR